jgi:hypothetical protein
VPEPATVLVVDDEIGPRESLRAILKSEYQVLVATEGTSDPNSGRVFRRCCPPDSRLETGARKMVRQTVGSRYCGDPYWVAPTVSAERRWRPTTSNRQHCTTRTGASQVARCRTMLKIRKMSLRFLANTRSTQQNVAGGCKLYSKNSKNPAALSQHCQALLPKRKPRTTYCYASQPRLMAKRYYSECMKRL